MLVTIAKYRSINRNEDEEDVYGIQEGWDNKNLDPTGVEYRTCETSYRIYSLLALLSAQYYNKNSTHGRDYFHEICENIWEWEKDSTQLELF